MAKTRHVRKRMSQRAIKQEMIDVALQFGHEHGDKVELDRRGIDSAIDELDSLRSTLLEVRDKGGIVVVKVGDHVITVYRKASRKEIRSGIRSLKIAHKQVRHNAMVDEVLSMQA